MTNIDKNKEYRWLGIFPILAMFMYGLLLSVANISNWMTLLMLYTFFSLLSFVPTYLIKNVRYRSWPDYINSPTDIRGKMIMWLFKIFGFFLVAMMTSAGISDLVSGPQKYNGECIVSHPNGGWKIRLFNPNNDEVNVNPGDFDALAGEQILPLKFSQYKCNSLVDIEYLKNLQAKVSLKKISTM